MEAVPKAKEIERLLAESEWIRGLARGLVGDSHRAEDLAQEAHLAALSAPVESSGSMRPWLASVSRNAARMWFRSEGARRHKETLLARDRSQQAEPSPEDLLGQLETQEQLSRLVRELPAELSDVILLHFFEGLSLQEIALLRDIPAGTVRWRKKRGLECLRERLDTTHGGDRQAWLSALAPLVAPRWRAGAQAATGAAATSGLLAPWIAMTLTWKLISIALFAALLSIPFVNGDGVDALDPSAGLETQDSSAAASGQRVQPDLDGATRLASLPDQERVTPAAPAMGELDRAAPPITRVRLRVVDARGEPVGNASVRPSPSMELEASHREAFEGLSDLELVVLVAKMLRTTGSDGVATWESDLLREDGIVDFKVEGPHFGIGNLRAPLEVGADIDLGDVVLSDAGAAKGRVVDSSGRGLSSIRVVAQRVERDGAGAEQQLPIDWTQALGLPGTRSGKLGRFELLGLASGEYRMYMQTVGQGPLPASDPFLVVAGVRTENVLIRGLAAREVRIPGKVVILGADGQPLRSASVRLEIEHMSSSGGVDGDGSWGSASNLARFAGGRMTVSDRHFKHHSKVIDPIPVDPSGLVVQLERAPTVQRNLTVTDQNGATVENVSVSILTDGLSGGPGNVSGTTEIDLPDRSRALCTINFYSQGYLPLSMEGVDTEDLPEPWHVKLRKIPGIQGRVLVDGLPAKRAKVHLFAKGQVLQVKKKGNAVSSRSFSDLSKATCDKQGVFQVQHSNDGSFVLIASARGYADALLELPNYEAVQGQGGITFAMNEGGEVKGTVFDAFGKPVPRAYVVLNHELHKLHRKRASKDGSFHFRGIPEGRWMLRRVEDFDSGIFGSTIEVDEDWSFPTNCTVEAGQTTRLDLHLPDPNGTSIRGVWKGEGEAGEGWSATLSTRSPGLFKSDPFMERWSNEQQLSPGQEIEFSAQPGRDYHLRLTHASLRGMLHRRIPASDLPAQIDPPTSFTTLRAHLRIPIASGETAEGLIVEWKQGAWTYRSFLSPKEDGTFGPTLVPAGTLTLTWKTPGSAEATDVQVEVLPDQERDVEL